MDNAICLLYLLLDIQYREQFLGRKWHSVKVNLHFQRHLELPGGHSLGHICEGISTLNKGGAFPWARGLG